MDNRNTASAPTGPEFSSDGLTKLEHVAAMAMQGLIAARYSDMEQDYIVEAAVEMAHALFDQLEKGNETSTHKG